MIPTPVRARPDAGAEQTDLLNTRATWGGGPMGLLVLRSARDDASRLWLEVRLQRRPNAAAGWIAADRTVLRPTAWRAVLRLRSRKVTVFRMGVPVRRFRAVIGAPGTPTPRGLFAIAEEIRQPLAGGFLGPWALHLTAHSNTLDNYGGGVGRVAMHGRGGASLFDLLGSAASHGCIRVNNGDIRWLAARARPGMPVRVRP